MVTLQAHRRPHRAQRHRVQRTLGTRRWVIERTISWLTGYRRLNHRHERNSRNYLAFLGLAAALCCYKRLVRLIT
jgi:transposase